MLISVWYAKNPNRQPLPLINGRTVGHEQLEVRLLSVEREEARPVLIPEGAVKQPAVPELVQLGLVDHARPVRVQLGELDPLLVGA